MSMTSPSEVFGKVGNYLKRLIYELMTDVNLDVDDGSYQVLNKLLYVLAPLLLAFVFYQYTKYMLIFNAFQYERSVKKHCGHFKKLSKQLKVLMKHYGNFYFRFMPMNHGRTLPRTYTLFTAIKEVLMDSNRPATRVVRTNLLFDLIRGNAHYSPQYLTALELNLRNRYDDILGEVDPLSDFNPDIMKCCREMIIQGIKDFEVMSTVYRVLETVMED